MSHNLFDHEGFISRYLGMRDSNVDADVAARTSYNLALQVEAGLLREEALTRKIEREHQWGRDQLQRASAADEKRGQANGELLFLRAILKRIAAVGTEGAGLECARMAQQALDNEARALWSSEKPTPGVWIVQDGERYFLGRVGVPDYDPTGSLWFMGVDQPWQECTWPIEDKDSLWLRLPDNTLPRST